MAQIELFPDNEPKRLPLVDAEVWYYENFFPKKQSDSLFEKLMGELEWHQKSITLFGKKVPQPRLTAMHGDRGIAYTYSGLTWQPSPWTTELSNIKDKVELIAEVSFSTVLLNLYRDGQDSMGWHSDDEPELGENPVIASVSFGETRKFGFKHRTKKDQRHALELTHGSLLLMKGETQHHWLHQIPKTRKPVSPRVNLTFRAIDPLKTPNTERKHRL